MTLACFETHGGRSLVEVSGAWIADEIDPADWLEWMLEQSDRNIISTKPAETSTGRAGDIVATWQAANTTQAGRFVAMKWDQRLFIVGCYCSVDHYPSLANDFTEMIAGFVPALAASRPLTEHTHYLEVEWPTGWTSRLPMSWQWLRRDSEREEGAFFEAEHQDATRYDEGPDALDGRLTILVIPRSKVRKPREASKRYLDALLRAGFTVEHENFVSEAPTAAFIQSWTMSSEVSRQERHGQLQCRVAMNDEVWFISAVVGPSREDDPLSWMRNKRALDVVYRTMEFRSAASHGGKA